MGTMVLMHGYRHFALAAVIIGNVVLAACSSTAVPAPSPSLVPSVQLTFASKGDTVQVHTGEIVKVTLDGPYWGFAPVQSTVLQEVGSPVRKNCRPEFGCSSVTENFRVMEAGSTEIQATRPQCGEALRCLNGMGTFTVTVSSSR